MPVHNLRKQKSANFILADWSFICLTAVILFFLICEWFRPLVMLSELTEVYTLRPFFLVIGLCLLLDSARCPEWMAWLVKLWCVLSVIGHYFYGSLPHELGWLERFWAVFRLDSGYALARNWPLVSGETRTFFFLLGWVLLIYVIHYFVFQRQRVGWFVAATIVYLLLLQLWGADTTGGIVRTFALGLLLMSLVHLPRLQRRFRIRGKVSGGTAVWPLVSAAVVCAVVAAGSMLSESGPAESELLSWEHLPEMSFLPGFLAQNAAEETLARTTGYDLYDGKLGGKLAPDDQPALTVSSQVNTYWRGETKSFYDGKGWFRPEERGQADLPEWPEDLTAEQGSREHDSGKNEDGGQSHGERNWLIVQEVAVHQPALGRLLFAGGEIVGVNGMTAADGTRLTADDLRADGEAGRYRLKPEVSPLMSYRLTVRLPVSDEHALRSLPAEYPEHIRQKYLQLPGGLPKRVRELAESIAGDAENPYDKAKKIESYLKANYAYNMEESRVPGEHEDFVDHFLFVQKSGYCDHFSTAMAVMLRSLGVPARWAKGFAPGEGTEEAGTYLVRNSDAHSWPEVYFPGAGWIPFEPTPGFYREESGAAALAAMQSMDGSEDTARVEERLAAWRERLPLLAGIAAGGVLLIAAWAVWQACKNRLLWMRQTKSLLRSRWRAVSSLAALEQIWLNTFRAYGKIKPSQTLREYVASLGLKDSPRKQAMLELVSMYESLRYDRAEKGGAEQLASRARRKREEQKPAQGKL
jgi:transglutaminase-like putative cysteine protease